MIRNGECKPGTLLCLTRDTVRHAVFQLEIENPDYHHDFHKIILKTEVFKGDFLIWLQDDNRPPLTEYSFCLHAQTSRVLALNVRDLEVVNLEDG